MKTLQQKTEEIYSEADIYDAICTMDEDVPFWMKRAGKSDNNKVLELCCGTGRLAGPLIKAGLSYTGLDQSESFLRAARAKLLNIQGDYTFVQADMRCFRLNTKFGLIVLPHNSIGHLYTHDDVQACLQSVHSHLTPDGQFIIQFFVPKYLDEVMQKRKLGSYTLPSGKSFDHYEDSKYDPITQINHIRWIYEFDDGTAIERHLPTRMIFPAELDSHLRYNGFEIENHFGWYDETPLEDDSKVSIVVCKAV